MQCLQLWQHLDATATPMAAVTGPAAVVQSPLEMSLNPVPLSGDAEARLHEETFMTMISCSNGNNYSSCGRHFEQEQ